MNDEMFIKKYEELLDKGYCDCNEMNCIDNNTPRRILKVVKNLQQENQELKKQLEELEKENLILREIVMIKKMAIPYKEINDKSLYDLYTIPSYSDLSKENQELKKQLKIKHNGFMASVDESCDLAKENQKYKEVIDKAIEWIKKRINSCTIEAESTTNDTMCKITISGLYNLLNILEEVE